MIFFLFLQFDYPIGYNFISISQGIRSMAMGEAFTAVSDDATGIFYNTAGLAFLEGFDSKFALYDMYNQLAILSFALAFPVKNFGFGFGMSLWGDEQQKYNEYGEHEGTFSNTEIFSEGAFSVKPLRYFSFGIGAKYLYSAFDNYTASGMLWDAGMLYIPNQFLKFGVSIQNLGFPRKFINLYEYPPSRLRTGGALFFPILNAGRFIYSIDIIGYPYRIDVGTGFELAIYLPDFVKDFIEADMSGIRIWAGFNTKGYSFREHFFYGMGIMYALDTNFYMSIEGIYTDNLYLGQSMRFGISLYYHPSSLKKKSSRNKPAKKRIK